MEAKSQKEAISYLDSKVGQLKSEGLVDVFPLASEGEAAETIIELAKRGTEQFDCDVHARPLRREALGAWEYHRKSGPSFWRPGPGGSSNINFGTA